MRVGVLGSGDVGRALATGFAARGHEVMIGSRSPDKDELVAWRESAGKQCSTGSFQQAAAFGDVLVLCCLGKAALDVVEMAGQEAFDGKVLIDVTNPLSFPEDGPPGLFVGVTDSLGERIQEALPRARVVKAFNTVSNTQMVDPSFEEPAPEMLICGDDPDAKEQVESILLEFGWPGAIDVGGIEACRWIEPLVPLWVRVGQVLGTWDHGWRVARPT